MSTYASWRGAATYAPTVTSGLINAEGNYAEIAASTSFDSSRLFFINLSGNAGIKYLMDLATGAALSETVRVADILAQVGTIFSAAIRNIELNVDIASGTRIASRARASAAGQVCFPIVMQEDRALASIADPVTYGAVTATSAGTQIDPGASINTKGGYSELTASTSIDHDALVFNIGSINTTPADANFRADIATGAALSETVIVPDIGFNSANTSDEFLPNVSLYQLAIPSGTRLAVRAQSSTNDATDRLFDCQLIGMENPAAPSGGGEHSAVF